MSVIRGSGLSDTAIIVIRWFGGTLLGTGGLVRAYTESASAALRNAPVAEKRFCRIYRFQIEYADYGRFESEAGSISPFRPVYSFSGKVSAEIPVPDGSENLLFRKLSDITRGSAVPEEIGTAYLRPKHH